MKIAMLGWEYPPHISGGLGTACEGLTMGLARNNTEILFVVPHLMGGEQAPHMRLIDSYGESTSVELPQGNKAGLTTLLVPSALSPYLSPNAYHAWIASVKNKHAGHILNQDLDVSDDQNLSCNCKVNISPECDLYSGDIFREVSRFASNVVRLLADKDFDIIHAHDWLTYPAGIYLAKLTGKPLIVHVHSLEFDRSGRAVNELINQIERWGLEAATSVVAVSHYTRNLIHREHGISLDKISVVHNDVYSSATLDSYLSDKRPNSKIVLFLGRITFQKGPDYFVEAAAKVICKMPEAQFVLAGSGDMLPQLAARIQQLGLEGHFCIPGFLHGQEVEKMFSLADVYVMPSVSEPFGISALEAISFNTPAIISRQSGVSEVLNHALKVDFWDIDRLADLIINALLYDELRQDMLDMAREEIKRVHWDAAAIKMREIYHDIARVHV